MNISLHNHQDENQSERSTFWFILVIKYSMVRAFDSSTKATQGFFQVWQVSCQRDIHLSLNEVEVMIPDHSSFDRREQLYDGIPNYRNIYFILGIPLKIQTRGSICANLSSHGCMVPHLSCVRWKPACVQFNVKKKKKKKTIVSSQCAHGKSSFAQKPEVNPKHF